MKAVINGLAPDRGLYFPQEKVVLSKEFIESIKSIDDIEICYEVINKYVGDEIPKQKLIEIIKNTISFKIPLKKIEDSIYSLELFHGPTLAFKDIGAKFMAQCLDYFKSSYSSKKITVLVATSGDTGGAVAKGFSGTKDVEVCILYPKGKISKVQEKQITTNGDYVKAIEVEGDFDKCQSMVKKAFNDEEIKRKLTLTSANSINIARWLPQMFYYFLAYKKINNKKDNLFSVPSGNFGNICAGLLSKSMGLPINHFIASTNANDTIPRYFKGGLYEPHSTKKTISNAMDVSDPSNFTRIQKIFNSDLQKLKKNVSSYSFDDTVTKEAMRLLYNSYNYLTCPHTAVGFLGLKKYLDIHKITNVNGIFVSTAHCIKFKDVVESSIKTNIKYPKSIKGILNKEKKSLSIENYTELKDFLLCRV
tara:strand:+ start:207 stop:1466 length:1260 start_codon:yes stop_codon:yes gene_type:complete